MLQVIDDTTSTMDNSYDDASTLLDDGVPLGDFLDEVELERKKLLKLMRSLKLMKYLQLEILKHLLVLALHMNCLRYLKVMLWMRRQLETF